MPRKATNKSKKWSPTTVGQEVIQLIPMTIIVKRMLFSLIVRRNERRQWQIGRTYCLHRKWRSFGLRANKKKVKWAVGSGHSENILALHRAQHKQPWALPVMHQGSGKSSGKKVAKKARLYQIFWRLERLNWSKIFKFAFMNYYKPQTQFKT